MKERIDAEIEKYWPQIKSKIGSISANTTDDQLEKLVLNAHKTLPMPVKIIIRKKWLVSFCQTNRAKLSILDGNDIKSIKVEAETEVKDESFEL